VIDEQALAIQALKCGVQNIEFMGRTCSNKVIGPPIGCKALQRPTL
jgi:hypothetical protein